jgi:hypothetical protein
MSKSSSSLALRRAKTIRRCFDDDGVAPSRRSPRVVVVVVVVVTMSRVHPAVVRIVVVAPRRRLRFAPTE